MLFDNSDSNRTVESLEMACSWNGGDLFQANLNSLLFGKFSGLWTKEHFYDKHDTSLCIKCDITTMNTQRQCGRMAKITETWLNTAVFGNMEQYNISNVAPTESHKMYECIILLLQPFKHKQLCKPTLKTGYHRSAYSEIIACSEWCTQPYQ